MTASTEHHELVRTDAEELLARITEAERRFAELVRGSEPATRAHGCSWTTHEVLAHVVSVSGRYAALARGEQYRRAESPREVDAINAAELQALAGLATSDLLERLAQERPARTQVFTGDPTVRAPFHGGALVDPLTWSSNWMGELLVHGLDVARAHRRRWPIRERDALLIVRGVLQLAPGYVDREAARGVSLLVELRVRGARPWVLRVHDGRMDSRPRRADDRPDAVLRTSARTLLALLYGRTGLVGAVRHGLLVVGGRRPWRALRLTSLVERP